MHESLVSGDDCTEAKGKKKGVKQRKKEKERTAQKKRMAKDGSGSVGARRGDRRRDGIAVEGNRGGTDDGAGRREVRLAAENQLAIALSRRSAIRWFERAWRNGERPTESGKFWRRTGGRRGLVGAQGAEGVTRAR